MDDYHSESTTFGEEALALEELDRLVSQVQSQPFEEPVSQTSLLQRIERFQHHEKRRLEKYVQQKKQIRDQNILHTFDAFQDSPSTPFTPSTQGGFFFSHEGLGVVVNPGQDFLKRFHDQGYHISQIDVVLVTKDDPKARVDLFDIYRLNQQYNLLCPEFHLINYYLNPVTFRKVASQLKPHFKQERQSVFSLDLFLDSETSESIELSHTISLNYMQGGPDPDNLLLTFHLKSTLEEEIKLTYISSTPCTDEVQSFAQHSNLLILGFENTSPSDLARQETLPHCLGYHGLYTLCDTIRPSLCVIQELAGIEGDIRLELAKQLSQDLQHSQHMILPSCEKLKISLEPIQVHVAQQEQPVPLSQVAVIQPHGPYSSLIYASKSDVLL